MSVYTVPAITLENEFTDLVFVGRYVDSLMASTGDPDYGVVVEWDDNGPAPGSVPVAFLTRRPGGWKRSVVLHKECNARHGKCDWKLGDPEDVNDH